MSLINQMLRDLEERRAIPAAAFEATLSTPTVSAAPGQVNRRALGYALAAITGVGIALLAWQWLASPADHAPVTVPLALSPASETGDIERTLPTGDDSPAVASVDPQTPAVEPAVAAVLEAKAAPGPTPATVQAPAPSVPVKVTADTVTAETLAPAPAAAKAAPAHAGPARFEITARPLTPVQQAQRHYTGAIRALRADDPAAGGEQLGQALSLDRNHHQARLLLASLYIDQQRSQDAEALLAEGMAVDPGHAPSARLHAQLLAGQGREQEAIQRLEAALPGAGHDADYHALLAGLYQRTSRPALAVEHYRTALQYVPGRGAWWLGLGLSLEQGGASTEAHAAYRQALKRPLTAALQDYVRTRMQQLPVEAQPGA